MRKWGWRVCPLTEHNLPWGPPREEEEVVRGSLSCWCWWWWWVGVREERRAALAAEGGSLKGV